MQLLPPGVRLSQLAPETRAKAHWGEAIRVQHLRQDVQAEASLGRPHVHPPDPG